MRGHRGRRGWSRRRGRSGSGLGHCFRWIWTGRNRDIGRAGRSVVEATETVSPWTGYSAASVDRIGLRETAHWTRLAGPACCWQRLNCGRYGRCSGLDHGGCHGCRWSRRGHGRSWGRRWRRLGCGFRLLCRLRCRRLAGRAGELFLGDPVALFQGSADGAKEDQIFRGPFLDLPPDLALKHRLVDTKLFVELQRAGNMSSDLGNARDRAGFRRGHCVAI